jgi:hypothetical protein
LGVEVAGALLDHRLHHFRLACSGFEPAHLERAIGDALLLRGTRPFDTLARYRSFIAEILSRDAPPNACGP